MVGQFSTLERKSIEPMALQVEAGPTRERQRFVSDVRGDSEGVLMFDETGGVKKDNDSVGVARQYCGTLGKGEHGQVGQVGGFAAYASQHDYAWVDKRLFL